MEPSQEQQVCYRHPTAGTRIVCQRCDRPICTSCMVPGAVGFQCPDCVTTGQKETRQAVGPYGGTRSRDPRITSFVLIALNVLVFAAILATGGSYGSVFDIVTLKAQGYCPAGGDQILLAAKAECLQAGYTWVDGVATGAWWQVITSAFAHSEALHIGFNMFALYALGPQLERVLGRARFLAVYLVSALVASAFVMWLATPFVSTLGASGAVFGLMAAVLLIAHKHKGNYQEILMWIGANVAITVVGHSYISWQGHLGGFVGGALVTAILLHVPKERRAQLQWPLIGLVTAGALAAIVVRALALA